MNNHQPDTRTRAPQRIALGSPTFGMGLLLLWAALMLLTAGDLWYLHQQEGGLEAAVNGASSLRGNWLVGLSLLAVVATAALVIYFRPSRSVLVLTGEGICLERFGRRVWQLAWSEYAGWRWYTAGDDQYRSVSLRFSRRDGTGPRVSMSAAGIAQLQQALREWAPGKKELPPQEGGGGGTGWFLVWALVVMNGGGLLYAWGDLPLMPLLIGGCLVLLAPVWLLRWAVTTEDE